MCCKMLLQLTVNKKIKMWFTRKTIRNYFKFLYKYIERID